MDLNKYLTTDEREQMDGLMKKAAERRKKDSGETAEENTILYFRYQYEGRKQTDGKPVEMRADYETDLENIMEQVCRFCQKYKFCGSCRKRREDAEDDAEWPF